MTTNPTSKRTPENAHWDYPPPRAGWRGAFDRFVGPGQTDAEMWLQLAIAGSAGVLLPALALWRGVGWTWLQVLLAGLLALDMTGGVVTNASAPAKRWYHRAGQGARAHLSFVALHLVQIALVAWLFRAGDWLWLGAVALYLLLAAGLIVTAPLYLQRPLAFGLLALALAVEPFLLTPTPGLAWFVPLLYLKLLVSHLLREEPWRPT